MSMILSLLLSACIPILSAPATISAPGSYCLASNLTHAEPYGAAVSIAADFVTLDLAGYSIIGTGGSNTTASGVYASGRRGVTVRNGTIHGFLYGVYINSSSHAAAVRDVLFLGNWYIGAWIHGLGAEISDCRVVNTGGSALPGYTRPLAIKAGGPGARVVRNVVSVMILPPGGEVVGLALDDAAGGLVRDNIFALVAATPTGYAIWSNGLNTNLVVQGNTFARFGGGVVFAQGAGVYRDNTSMDVAIPFTGGTDGGGNQ